MVVKNSRARPYVYDFVRDCNHVNSDAIKEVMMTESYWTNMCRSADCD